jgi:hypothetical protein
MSKTSIWSSQLFPWCPSCETQFRDWAGEVCRSCSELPFQVRIHRWISAKVRHAMRSTEYDRFLICTEFRCSICSTISSHLDAKRDLKSGKRRSASSVHRRRTSLRSAKFLVASPSPIRSKNHDRRRKFMSYNRCRQVALSAPTPCPFFVRSEHNSWLIREVNLFERLSFHIQHLLAKCQTVLNLNVFERLNMSRRLVAEFQSRQYPIDCVRIELCVKSIADALERREPDGRASCNVCSSQESITWGATFLCGPRGRELGTDRVSLKTLISRDTRWVSVDKKQQCASATCLLQRDQGIYSLIKIDISDEIWIERKIKRSGWEPIRKFLFTHDTQPNG